MHRPQREGRNARRQARLAQDRVAGDPAWRQWVNPYPPVPQFSDDQIEAIHLASLRVLNETGLRILDDTATQLLIEGGHRSGEDRLIRFDTEALLEQIAHAPSEVTLKGRGADRNITIGGHKVGICTTGGTPNFSDLDDGRRPGTLETLERFCKLAQHYDVIHMIGPFVEPQDVPTHIRHLHMTRTVLTHTDKVPFVFFRGTQAVADAFEMIRIAHGMDAKTFRNTPVCYSVANSNSPLQLDHLMCRGIIDAARAGQLMVLTPFTLAGAMAPVTLAGALVQQNAEGLAGLALAQLARPGAPVCYGSFTSNVDMRTGSPAFGTPEYTKAAFASGQLARRYGIPLRSSGVTASNAPDAQAAYEMQMSLWGALMGGTNLLLHGAGWLEGGLTASAEKFIMDIEMLQMFAELFKPVDVSEASLAVEAIAEVGPGGHFFGSPHTMERFETAFYKPLLSDWQNFENWRDDGSVDATMRANRIYHQTLHEAAIPAMDVALKEELEAFVARRAAEGGADIER